MKKNMMTFLLLTGLFMGGCTSAPDNSKETAQLSIIQLDPEAQEVLKGEETDITIKTDPSGVELSPDDFTLSGGSIIVDKDQAKFKADEPGEYTIQAHSEGVESNTVTLKVVNAADEEKTTAKADDANDQNDQKTTSDQKETSDQSSDKTDTGTKTGQSNSSTPASSAQTDSQSEPVSVDVNTLLSDPDQYVGKTVAVSGLLPQEVLNDSNGKPQFVLRSSMDDNAKVLNLTGKTDFDFGGCAAKLTGVFEKNSSGGYDLNVESAIQESDGSAGDNKNRETGTSVSAMPQKGTFQFTVNDVIIRNGTDGLESPASGYVYDAGMKVNYSGLYQKDGWTWITYTSKGGKTHSVAIGNDKVLLYGFLAGQ